MGCYGIGVTRIVGAAIEQNHDERGIVWPDPIAPFQVAIVPLGYRRSDAGPGSRGRAVPRARSTAGVDVLLDDRDERPGVMFADMELIGIPHRVVDRRPRPEGRQNRVSGPARRVTPTAVAVADAAAFLQSEAVRTLLHSRLVLARSPRPRRRRWRAHSSTSRSPRACRRRCSRAISDSASPQLKFADPEDGYKWLLAMSERLAKRIPDTTYRVELLKTVHYEATRAGLDPQLVLGLIQVESGFRKYAVSTAGARGLMQVMPFWVGLIGEQGRQPLPPADEPPLRLRDPAPLPRHREGRPAIARSAATTAASGNPEYPNLVLRPGRRRTLSTYARSPTRPDPRGASVAERSRRSSPGSRPRRQRGSAACRIGRPTTM